MGYYTNYTLTTTPDNFTEEMKNKLMEINPDYFEREEWVEELLNGDMNSKWYSNEEDILELSKFFPDILFELEGEGEDNEDMWKKYFKNGKSQYAKAKIIFEDFDESKLK